jgi:hypothetical protein
VEVEGPERGDGAHGPRDAVAVVDGEDEVGREGAQPPVEVPPRRVGRRRDVEAPRRGDPGQAAEPGRLVGIGGVGDDEGDLHPEGEDLLEAGAAHLAIPEEGYPHAPFPRRTALTR